MYVNRLFEIRFMNIAIKHLIKQCTIVLKNCVYESTGLGQLSKYCYDYNQSKKFITAKKSRFYATLI